MAEVTRPFWAKGRWGIGILMLVALGLRVGAAVVVTWYAARVGKPCVFGDTTIYLALARTIVEGTTYQVSQWGVPHYALRTPGYPLFLAGCLELFGPSLLAVRLVQAVLGLVVVWGVARLTLAAGSGALAPDQIAVAASVALGLAAVEPYVVALSALVLSEAVFLPLMMLGLWGVALLWRLPTERATSRPGLVAGWTGVAMGGAILARPSWALFVPLILLAWVVGSTGQRSAAIRGSLIVAMATALVMAPWWARNERVVGKFVPTALWVGASLLDGIGPQADGSSDMRFVDAPDVRSLGEVEQDELFRRRAGDFARAHPSRVAALAVVKLGRFWSPWPNADTLRNRGVAAASALVTLPVFALVGVGVWDRRRDFRALTLLMGPLLYFCGLHLVFVSSIRYRIPGMIPALGLAGFGWVRLASRVQGAGRRDLTPAPGTANGSEAAAR